MILRISPKYVNVFHSLKYFMSKKTHLFHSKCKMPRSIWKFPRKGKSFVVNFGLFVCFPHLPFMQNVSSFNFGTQIWMARASCDISGILSYKLYFSKRWRQFLVFRCFLGLINKFTLITVGSLYLWKVHTVKGGLKKESRNNCAQWFGALRQ